MTEPLVFFTERDIHGYLSNFYPTSFDHENVTFRSSEEFFMYSKATFFGDIEIANRILKINRSSAHDLQKEIKRLGRLVRNFDEKKWANSRYDIMKKGLFLKFSQNSDIKNKLIATGNRMLVEGSPYDKVWGSGLNKFTTITFLKEGRSLPGQNLLGKALMEVRSALMQ